MFAGHALSVIDEEAATPNEIAGFTPSLLSTTVSLLASSSEKPGIRREVRFRGNALTPRELEIKPSARPQNLVFDAVSLADANETIQGIHSTALALLSQESAISSGTTIGASYFVAYAMSKGRVCIINRSNGDRALLHLPGFFLDDVSIADLAVHGNKIAGVTSDGGLVIWEMPEKLSKSNSSEGLKLLICIIPSPDSEALRCLKWFPGTLDTLAVASRTTLYLFDLQQAAGLASEGLLSHVNLAIISRVFLSPFTLIAFDFDVTHNAIAMMARQESLSPLQTLTLWDTELGEMFWSHEFHEKLEAASLAFVDGSIFIGWERDTAFTLFSFVSRSVTSSIRLLPPQNLTDSESAGSATYDIRTKTIWITNSHRRSIIGIRIGRDSPSSAPGDVFVTQIAEFCLPKAAIHLAIPFISGDLDGEGARAACTTARIFPGDLALVAFCLHATGVDQLLIRKETFDLVLPPERVALALSQLDPVPPKLIPRFPIIAVSSSPRKLGDSSIYLDLDTSPGNFLQHVQHYSSGRARAWISRALQNAHTCKSILAWRGEAAQSLLNHLQKHSDDYDLDPITKRLFVSALIRLSRLSGLYPHSLVRDDIQLIGTDPVAAGRHGEVWKGSKGDGELVAIKVLRVYLKSDTEKMLQEFSTEAVTWRQLSHPNVLSFYGIYHLNNNRLRVCLVSPWMENGNIVQFLVKVPDADRPSLVLDVARGLEYLHTSKPSIIHGDLKGVNILVKPSGRACLADFGLASAEDSQAVVASSSSNHRITGTSRWQAPELLDTEMDGSGRNSLASDIYSFACVCYEVFTGNIPFHELPNDYRVIIAVTRKQRPPPPPYQLCEAHRLTMETWNLIEACWSHQPGSRPTASRVVSSLRNLPQYSSTDYYTAEEYVIIESELSN